MQILIGLFQRHHDGGWGFYWTLERAGATVQVNHDTWPRWRDDDSAAEHPVALGVITLTHDSERNPYKPWRAECNHPADDMRVETNDRETAGAALEELKRAVRER